MYYHVQTDEILGAELFGEYGVDKRVDVLATAIYAKLKVSDLSQLDLAYAPPFSPAKDPIVVTGFMSENISSDKCSQLNVLEFDEYIEQKKADEYLLIDVRNLDEYEEGFIPNAINMPLDHLRNTISNIENKEQPVIIYCQRGLRGYLARLIFKHNGFNNVISIAGGFKVWQMHGNKAAQKELVYFF